MLLFAGLGNPGPEHAWNRHNVGFMALDAIAQRYGFAPYRARFHGLVADGSIDGERVVAVKPRTYMNRSGIAVGEAARFYKLDGEDVVVLHDELDLAPGKIRIKVGGSTAGHNGLRSIDSHIGKDYRRIRIGIGHPGDKKRVQRHVLSDFAKADQPLMRDIIDAVCEALPILVDGDDAGFMTKVALLCPPPKPAAAETDAG